MIDFAHGLLSLIAAFIGFFLVMCVINGTIVDHRNVMVSRATSAVSAFLLTVAAMFFFVSWMGIQGLMR